MTLQLRHLSSLLRAKTTPSAPADVPGLAYYTEPNRAVSGSDREAPTSAEAQALEAMYGYYSPAL